MRGDRADLCPAPAAQQGAISVLAGLMIVLLIGFAGLAVDIGQAIVQRNEVQAAADSCALAAALELNGGSDAPARAASAGAFLSGRNRQRFQAASALLPAASVTFSSQPSGPFVAAGSISGANAVYVRCSGSISGVASQFMAATGISNFQVRASATAGNVPSMATCSAPMALASRGTGTNFGFTPGDVASLGTQFFFAYVTDDGSGANGDLSIAFTTYGVCNVSTQPGRLVTIAPTSTNIREAWNSRFGVYQRVSPTYSVANATPDLSGHGYSTGTPPFYPDYLANQVPQRTPFTGSIPSYAADPNVNRLYGGSYRRLTIMPVINCAGVTCANGSAYPLVGWACVLMLAPVRADELQQGLRIEYVSNASAVTTPCRAPGVPGGPGSIGPRVPTLVS